MSRTKRSTTNRWYRRVRTQSERRLVTAAKEDGVHVRPKRNASHLPTAWDDIKISASYETDHRSAGTIIAEEARARCNSMTVAEREQALSRAMQIIYSHV